MKSKKSPGQKDTEQWRRQRNKVYRKHKNKSAEVLCRVDRDCSKEYCRLLVMEGSANSHRRQKKAMRTLIYRHYPASAALRDLCMLRKAKADIPLLACEN